MPDDKFYKVWVLVEKIDEANDIYKDVGEPVDVACYASKAEADAVVRRITDTFCDEDTKADWKARRIYPYETR